MATLDNGKYCIVYPSGTAALTGISMLLNPEDHIICGIDVYSGTSWFFDHCSAPKQKIEVTYADARDTDEFISKVKPNTKVNISDTYLIALNYYIAMRKRMFSANVDRKPNEP